MRDGSRILLSTEPGHRARAPAWVLTRVCREYVFIPVSCGSLGGDCHASLRVIMSLWWFAGCDDAKQYTHSTQLPHY